MSEPRQSGALASSLGALLALVASACFAHGSSAFSLDDAYIHLSYAKSLRLGQGFSYNPGDWELGATSPLWAVLLAPLSLRDDVLGAVQLLGACLHATGAFLTGMLAFALSRRALASLAASVLVALHPLLLQASVSGMEVSLATALWASMTWCCVRERYAAAGLVAFCSVFARPEALVFAGALSLGASVLKRKAAPLAVAAGALLAMALWSGYCALNAGHLLPNTFYAKADFQPLEGLRFVALRVLGEEPWLLGVGGAWLIVRRLCARTPDMWEVCGAAYLITLLAIALGRTLSAELLFTQQRYFACVAFVPCALSAAAIGRPRDAGWLAPVVLATLALLPRQLARTRAQEHNTRALHVEVASYVNAALPHDTRIAVEGAGALRYFTARTLHVTDVLGLNDRHVMHAGSSLLRLCAIAAERPAYLALPDALIGPLSALFQGELIQRFHEPRFSHVLEPYPWTVHLVRVTGLHPQMVERCRAGR